MFTGESVPIQTISNAYPAVVTTTTNHNLTSSQVVRLVVPQDYGMIQLNAAQVIITVLGATTFSIQTTQVPVAVSIDSRNFDPFVTASNPGLTAQVLPMGAGPTPLSSTPFEQINHPCVSLLDDATVNISTSEIPF